MHDYYYCLTSLYLKWVDHSTEYYCTLVRTSCSGSGTPYTVLLAGQPPKHEAAILRLSLNG